MKPSATFQEYRIINNFQVCGAWPGADEGIVINAEKREENHRVPARLPGATQQVQIGESSREQTSSPPPAHRRMRAPEMRARSREAELNAGSSSGCSQSRFNPRRASQTRLSVSAEPAQFQRRVHSMHPAKSSLGDGRGHSRLSTSYSLIQVNRSSNPVVFILTYTI